MVETPEEDIKLSKLESDETTIHSVTLEVDITVEITLFNKVEASFILCSSDKKFINRVFDIKGDLAGIITPTFNELQLQH